jgi:hypothetical protein
MINDKHRLLEFLVDSPDASTDALWWRVTPSWKSWSAW